MCLLPKTFAQKCSMYQYHLKELPIHSDFDFPSPVTESEWEEFHFHFVVFIF